MPDKPINDRIAYLEKRQELLASAVSDMQRVLYEQVLEEIDAITADPTKLDILFRKFTNTTHAKVIKQFAGDILSVGKLNGEYFKAIAEDVTTKDYAAIKKTADQYLLDRFGLTTKGEMVKDGFISTFIEDPTVKRQLKEFAYKSQSSGVGLQEFKKGFKEIITGTPEKNGAFERQYNTFAYDTYQQADAAIQEVYAEELGLTAFLYLGGVIKTTRPFCKERAGKVYLKSEIESWKDLDFGGKPANYNPFKDRGGFRCRHHFSAITAKQAMRRRPDLEEDENGNLRVKA